MNVFLTCVIVHFIPRKTEGRKKDQLTFLVSNWKEWLTKETHGRMLFLVQWN